MKYFIHEIRNQIKAVEQIGAGVFVTLNRDTI